MLAQKIKNAFGIAATAAALTFGTAQDAQAETKAQTTQKTPGEKQSLTDAVQMFNAFIKAVDEDGNTKFKTREDVYKYEAAILTELHFAKAPKAALLGSTDGLSEASIAARNEVAAGQLKIARDTSLAAVTARGQKMSTEQRVELLTNLTAAIAIKAQKTADVAKALAQTETSSYGNTQQGTYKSKTVIIKKNTKPQQAY